MKSSQLLNFIINIFYIPLVICAIWGAVNCLFSSIIKTDNWLVFFLGITVIVGIGSLIFHPEIIASSIKKHVNQYRYLYFIIGFLLLILWQLYVANMMMGISAWDPGIIFFTAIKHYKNVWVNIHQYFSMYPNTIFLLLFERGIWTLFGMQGIKQTIWIFEIINIILIDIAMIFIFFFIKNVVKSKIVQSIGISLEIILMGITPWMSIIYSDNLAFFLAATELFLLNLWQKKKANQVSKIMISFIFGIVAAFDLLIKPSTIIFFIALLGMMAFNLKNIIFKLKRWLVYGIAFLTAFIIVSTGFKVIENDNLGIKINSNLTFSMAHFAAMGIHGTGGYYDKDVITDQKIKSPTKRNESDRHRWEKRFDKMGITGYLIFLADKQAANFGAGGSQGWGCEGGFLKCFNHQKTVRQSLPRHLFASNQNLVKGYNAGFFIFVQLFWCIGLIMMLCVINGPTWTIQLLKVTFIGFCLFLLLFESGRSRYLIQFLPFIILLMGIGTQRVVDKYRKIKYTPRH